MVGELLVLSSIDVYFGFNVHDRGLWKTGLSSETSSPSTTIAVVRWLFPLQTS